MHSFGPKAKALFWGILGLSVKQSYGGCSTGSDGSDGPSPLYDAFVFPQWANDGDSAMGKEYGGLCTQGSDFYLRFDGNDMLNSTAEFKIDHVNNTANFTMTANFTCAQALAPDSEILDEEDVPIDDPSCCTAYRFRDDVAIEAEVEERMLSLTLYDVYGENATHFMTLCEEMWACNSYVDQYSSMSCLAKGGKSCPAYKAQSLCFNEAYYTEDEIDSEMMPFATFILNICFGAGDPDFDFENPTNGYSIEELDEEMDAVCQTARDLSNKMTFVAADEGICDELIQCLIDVSNSPDSPSSSTKEDFNDVRYDLCNGDLETLTARKDETCSLSTSVSPIYQPPTGDVGCRPLPFCPENLEPFFTSYTPAYPDHSGYEALIPSYAISNGYDNRSTANTVAQMEALLAILKGALIAANAIKDMLPSSIIFFFKVIPVAILEVACGVIQAQLDMWELHDGIIDSAEIEAIYENTRQMLDGSAAIYDEVVCRCADDYFLSGQGCDGKDNNCDQIVDDCTEDNVAPEIDTSQAFSQCSPGFGRYSKRWFLTEDDAVDCVSSAAFVKDDCDETIQFDSSLSGTCFSSKVTLTATDACGNVGQTKRVPVAIDLEAPVVSCSLGGATDIRLVDDGGVMTNIDLQYEATDNCGGDLNVTVELFSNELEDFNGEAQAVFFQSGAENDAAGLYLSTKACWTDGDGTCVRDPSNTDPSPSGFQRLYTVQVRAIDQAGREAEPAECTVHILPSEMMNSDSDLPAKSTQRFSLASYVSTFSVTPSLVKKTADFAIPTPGAKWYTKALENKCAQDCHTAEFSCDSASFVEGSPLFETVGDCCASMAWIEPNFCEALSTGESSGLWFADAEAEICKNDCNNATDPKCVDITTLETLPTTMYNTTEECCADGLFWVDQDSCNSVSVAAGKFAGDTLNSMCVMIEDDCPEGYTCVGANETDGNLYANEIDCCKGQLQWIDPAKCVADTQGVKTNKWVSDAKNLICVQDCDEIEPCFNISQLSIKPTVFYDSAIDCCKDSLYWTPLGECEAASLGGITALSGLVDSNEWYEGDDFKCVQNCEGDSPCGGILPYPTSFTKYDTASECCEGNFDWYDNTLCEYRSKGEHSGQFYSDNVNACKQDCVQGAHPACDGAPTKLGTKLYETAEKCCQKEFFWRDEDDCIDDTMGVAPTGTYEFYMDWEAEKCKQDCEGVAPCAGILSSEERNWMVLYSTEEACCKNVESWIPRLECPYAGSETSEFAV